MIKVVEVLANLREVIATIFTSMEVGVTQDVELNIEQFFEL